MGGGEWESCEDWAGAWVEWRGQRQEKAGGCGAGKKRILYHNQQLRL